ncbi:MAG: hypothetical protein GXZ02_07225, partial [Clostridiales bacterium]|nr:hypothetical protein [Clostridiales bacterium]
MKNKITKLLALMMAIAIVFSLAGCGKDKDEETTTAPGETTTLGDETTTLDETTAVEETTADGETTLEGDTTAVGQTTTAVAANTIPTTKAEILTAYTDILNQAKKTDKPGFSAIEFQAV